MIRRRLLAPYLLVGGGLTGGLLLGIFVFDAEPAVLGWIFGAGGGLMLGAFIAALTSNEPLVGRGALPPPPLGDLTAFDDDPSGERDGDREDP